MVALSGFLECVYKEGVRYLLSTLEGAVYPEGAATPYLLRIEVQLRRYRDTV